VYENYFHIIYLYIHLHTIRKDEYAVERIVLDWNPQGTRNTKEDLEVSYGRGTERREDVEGGEEVVSRQK
jgi:hypothetical protein